MSEYCDWSDSGWVREDDLPDLEHCRKMLKSVMRCIYQTGDLEVLYDCLEELCNQLEVDFRDYLPGTQNALGQIKKEKEAIN